MDTSALVESLTNDLARLKSEAVAVLDRCVLPSWTGPLHGFPYTLYGFMMAVFSYVDLLSAYWRGSEQAQTARMVAFMQTYTSYDREMIAMAVQVWRHKLMHTSRPRALKDPASGKVVYWLLHWYM